MAQSKNDLNNQLADNSLSSVEPEAAVAYGNAMARLMVAQTSGMMVEDGGAFVQNVTQISLAAIAVATERFVKTYNPLELFIIQQAMNTIEQSAKVFTSISTVAGESLEKFPS